MNVRRCDVFEDGSTKFVKDADGCLVGRAVVTTIGVFSYMNADGSVINELRLPEEVFSKEALDSLCMIPVTLGHPAEFVTPDNVGALQVGTTGESVSRVEFYSGDTYSSGTGDGTQVTIPLRITKKEAVDAVEGGRRALSCGYSTDLEKVSGVWCGMHYDAIQRNIRYNHVAIVDAGRAGDSAIIRMDDAFVPVCRYGSMDRRGSMNRTLVVDSVSYECDEKVCDHVDALVRENDKMQGQLDAAQLRVKQLEADMAGMIKKEDLSAMVREYQAVKDTADKFGVAIADSASLLDAKRAVMKVVLPSLAQKIDGGSEEYVNGLFDTAKDLAPRVADSAAGHAGSDAPAKDGGSGENRDSDGNFDVQAALNKRLQDKYHR